MPRIKTISWVGLGLLSLGAVLLGSRPLPLLESPAASRAFDLPPEKPVRQGLREGESHDYRLPLAAGEVVDVTVEQEGIDVSLTLWNPDGEALLSMDTPKDTRGTERLFSFAEAGGVYRLRVEVAAGKGSYVLLRAKPRPAGSADRLRARAWREYSQGESLRRTGTIENQRRALVHYDKAFRLWRTLENPEQQAIALYRRGGILRASGDLRGAVAAYERALPLLEDPGLRLNVLNRLAILLLESGDTQRAFQMGQKALALAPRAGDPVSHAAALNNLGLVYRRWGETTQALEYFERSQEKWREVGDHPQRASTLCNQGDFLLALGHPKPVLEIAGECLRIHKKVGDSGGEAYAYQLLGVAFYQLGSRGIALSYLELSRQKAQDAGNRRDEGLALNHKGSILLALDNPGMAREAFEEAGRIARESRNPDNEAFSLSGLGHVLLRQGDAAGALESFERSRRLYGELGDPIALSMALYGSALAERGLGRIDDSLATIDEALDLVEELREGIGQHDLRLHVIGVRTDLYDLRVDLLLRLHERRPGQGLDAMAFAASEQRRARSLLDMVRKMGVEVPLNLSKESLRRQEGLRLDLQRLSQEKLRIVSGAEKGARSLPEVRREIQETIARWEELSEEMRRQSPAYAAVAAPKLAGVREVQELLDTDTALIAYTVGEERSFLWWIERDVLEVHQNLPRRAVLEALAGDAYDFLSKPSQTKERGAEQRALTRLGTSLLGPVADRLGRVRRIAVVADETLQTLPFAVLPVPGSGEPLLESHAVVQLPSASLAVALRSRQKGRATPPKVMVIFGDPVFNSSDPRILQGSARSGDLPPGELPSLPGSSREVEDVLKQVPAARSRRFIGFEATRDAAMDPGLADYRYVHFATHGFVDPDNPNLSGIQLSRFGPQGEPLEGLLPFYEVYNLSLPADLVTLNACRTVDGPRVRGEGPLGMSRSFLYAGASRVIGTLWNVDDRDAAELMTFFYQALLRDGKPPAVALQEAQKAMRARERTRDPYHWAGYVLQGDWR